ncbi:MAG: hypothetical protein NTW30_02490 [Candidatus Aenigmarchaeota archaeon]|nr:hypothetical protein [Candidatus Aenigmarchaeota archaeon]
MREYRPKVKCTGAAGVCIEQYCPVFDLGYGGKISEQVLGENLMHGVKNTKNTVSNIYDIDGTVVTVTLSKDFTPGNCRFWIRTKGPYENELLEKFKREIAKGVPKIEITDK